MSIGLKRGTVRLADHNSQWETIAAETIQRLWCIFGSLATDMQHIGSTAIRGIKAKPIIDIAVAVKDFAAVDVITPALETASFLRRHWENDAQLLLACGDYSKPDGAVTHFIHVVKTGGREWFDYINFRDYMNAHPKAAKEYEALKLQLAAENPVDQGREKYLAGKSGFIAAQLMFARIWDDFGRAFISIEPICKGWSEDKKYCVTNEGGTKYLLRVTPAERLETRKSLFAMLKQVDALGIPMCRPVDFGLCADGVYSLQTWIDGEDLEAVLPLLPETEQYVLGMQSGEILKAMHAIAAPKTNAAGMVIEEWSARFNRKTSNKIQKYRACGLRFEGDEQVIAYIEDNRHLLENRPQCFQHGDYHIGNMMLENGELRIIDFDRYDFGDPWEEFNRIVWSAQASPHFATGQLRGYFGGEPPIEFFKLLAFYISSNTLSSIYWAIPFGQDEIDTMLKQTQDVLRWFNNMQNPVPTWYLKNFYIQYIDGVPLKLKSPFDLDFVHRYGTVFKVFDDQDSGNLCFGVKSEDGRSCFVKFAGAPTEHYGGDPATAIARLKAVVPVYLDLAHPALIRLIKAEAVGGGYAAVFEWVDAACMGRMYPLSRQKFMSLPWGAKVQIFEAVMDFHAHVAAKGYVAIDFYDGSLMYDFKNTRTVICDIDFYTKRPFINNMGRLWGSSRFMSPEEFQTGALIDEVSNVYVMGATAFALFSEYDRSPERWPLGEKAYAVVRQATSDERSKRQQSIQRLIEDWQEASGYYAIRLH